MAWGERLGCAASYTVTIHYQGGDRVYCYLETVESVTWSRERRGTSTAQVRLSAQALTPACARLLRDLWPLAHEVTVYRDDRAVWQGPLIRRTSSRTDQGGTTITLDAEDCSYWFKRRMPRVSRRLDSVEITSVGRAVVESTFGVRDPNLATNVVTWPTARNITHSIQAYGRWAIDELSEVAAQGMDWSYVGRTLFMTGPTDETSPMQGQLSSDHLLGQVELELDGDQYASLVYGAPQPQENVWNALEGIGGASPYFGLVEYVAQTDHPWNLNEDGEFEPAGEDGLSQSQTRQALIRAAQARHTQMSRPPITVRCADGARLSPEAPISLDRLVPGGRVDVALDERDFLFSLVRPMRLMRVDVTWDGDGESIGVSLVQIGTASDNEIEEI